MQEITLASMNVRQALHANSGTTDTGCSLNQPTQKHAFTSIIQEKAELAETITKLFFIPHIC